MRRGYTLIEMMVVITIILMVSIVALPTVASSLKHRQVSESARLLQGALAGARDAAIRDNAPAGIRLLKDPALAGCFNAILPLSRAPNYTDGRVSVSPATAYSPAVLGTTLAIVLEEVSSTGGVPNEPVSWNWNIRVGDKVQVNGAGPWYTVCGPMFAVNSEGFINVDPTIKPPLGHEYLLLTDGRDDNGNGFPDEGWDGVDNDGDGLIDESTCKLHPDHGEWEQERWQGSLSLGTTNATYVVARRPVPAATGRTLFFPSQVVIDSTRSKLPTQTADGSIDLQINPDGSMSPVLMTGVPSSIGLAGSFWQFWLSERPDVGQAKPAGQWWLLSANTRTGQVTSLEQPDLVNGYNDAKQ